MIQAVRYIVCLILPMNVSDSELNQIYDKLKD